MKNIKFLICLVFLFITEPAIAQQAFKTIAEARQNVAQGNYKKALKLLKKVQYNDVSCGNAAVEINNQYRKLKRDL